MPFTIIVAIPEPLVINEEIELENIQAYYIEDTDEYKGFYAGYKPAIVRKLGIENIDVYYLGCYEDDDNWSSYNLIETTDDDTYLNVSDVQLTDFRMVCEQLLTLSEIGKFFMILHNGVEFVEKNDDSYSPELPSEKYVDYELRFISFVEFLEHVNQHSSIFKIESIWEIYKF